MIRVFNNCDQYKISKRETILLIKNVLKSEKVEDKELNIIFVDDKYILYLNKKFLKRSYVTDVISFALDDAKKLDGEVYIDLKQAERQAKKYKVGFDEEVSRLVIHGILHLIGYDDIKLVDKKLMNLKENLYLKKFKLINARKNIRTYSSYTK